jgi:hypothetical protein
MWRGRLRAWKLRHASGYRAFLSVYRQQVRSLAGIMDFCKRGSATGRRRAFGKISRALGPALVLEGLRLDNDFPLAVWSILKPRQSVSVDAPVESGRRQHCCCVNYVLAGVLPRWAGDEVVGTLAVIAEGLWTLEVSDHALGRAVEYSGGMLPDAIIADAHHNLLRLRTEQIDAAERRSGDRMQFLLRAGAGAFVCEFVRSRDVSLGNALGMQVRTATWVDDDRLRDDQRPLFEDGVPGARLQDAWLLPVPLRRLWRDGDTYRCLGWAPGLPELLAKPRGSA